MKRYTQTQKLTIAGICIALYIAVMMCTQTFAFGQYQVRAYCNGHVWIKCNFSVLDCAVWHSQCYKQYHYGRAWASRYDWRRHCRHCYYFCYCACQKIRLRQLVHFVCHNFNSRPGRAGLAFRAARFAVLAAGIFCIGRAVYMRPCRSGACNCT